MLDARSALASVQTYTGAGISLHDASDITLTQFAWFAKPDEKGLKDSFGPLPTRMGQTAATDHGLLMRTGPQQLWLVAEGRGTAVPTFGPKIVVTALSSSRTRMAVKGAKAREVLARCAPIDFHASAFKPGSFVMTGIHHTPAVIHAVEDDVFHVYAMRTFGRAVWEWLEDTAKGLTSRS